MEDLIVKKSKIHGKGVFANRVFKKGEIVVNWENCSEELTKEEADNLPEKEKQYLSIIEGKYILLKSPARYVNHSCESNTRATKKGDVAKREIKKGEEITADYISESVPVKMKCNCGSKNCRGMIDQKCKHV